VTPQLRRLAGRHARYFDNTLRFTGALVTRCEDASVSARENP
jgi:hypothetical protein